MENGEGLAPSLPPDPRPPEAAPFEPALGGVRDVLAIARRAPARAARLEAIIRLGLRQDPAAYPALADASTDPDWVARKYALSGLGALRLPAALPILRAGLADAHVDVRRAAARALKGLDDGHHEADWLAAVADEDALVRAAAYEGLHRYPGGTDALLAGLEDPAWLPRFMALEGLMNREPDPRLVPALLARLDADAALAPHVGRALGRLAAADGRVLDGVLELLPPAPPWRRLAIAATLGAIPSDPARKALAGLIGHPDPEVEAAVVAQGEAMAPWLHEALADEAWIRRWHAARLLGRLGADTSAQLLLPLTQDPRLEVRLAALEALAAVPTPAALPDLALCAADPVWRVREAAAKALGALLAAGVTEARAVLQRHGRDARDEVREAVASAIGGQAGGGAAS